MKRCLLYIIVVVLIITLLPIHAFAATRTQNSSEIIYFDDGSYITIELSMQETRASGTKTGTKTYIYRTSNGTEEWRAVLTGQFQYTGTSATCTMSTCNVNIINDNWNIVSRNASINGSSALADLTMGYKVLGITTKKHTVNMSLTCDANGNLS